MIKKLPVKNGLVFLISLFPYFLIPISAQQKAVQYDKDFVFKDGIYLSFINFKNNAPVLTAKIVSNYNKADRDFLDKVLSKATFTYLDSAGTQLEAKSVSVWGYCQNGSININHGTDFNRMSIIGSISHFVATTQVKIGNADPFSYNDPFNNNQQYTYVSIQYILDFESGSILEFTVDNMEIILRRDEVLYKEFSGLKKKKKRNSIFLYLRKYNEKHPIFFPE